MGPTELPLSAAGPPERPPSRPRPRCPGPRRHFPQQRGREQPRRRRCRPPRPPLTFRSRCRRTLLFPPLSKLRRLSSARRSITRRSLSRRRFSGSEPGTPDPPRDGDSPCAAAGWLSAMRPSFGLARTERGGVKTAAGSGGCGTKWWRNRNAAERKGEGSGAEEAQPARGPERHARLNPSALALRRMRTTSPHSRTAQLRNRSRFRPWGACARAREPPPGARDAFRACARVVTQIPSQATPSPSPRSSSRFCPRMRRAGLPPPLARPGLPTILCRDRGVRV